jgi:hypothetical protein
MANTKISALTSASTPLAGTEVLPIVQSGSTVKVASDDLTVRNIRANATTGILQVTGPAAASTRVVTVPNANWTAARTDAAQSFTGDQTLSTGNLVVGTSGKGVDFSIVVHSGSTSKLLSDYEEGTFTPTVRTGITSVGYSTQTGYYTKVGNTVTFTMVIVVNAGTTNGTQLTFGGLPFTTKSTNDSAGNFGYASSNVVNSTSTNLPTLTIFDSRTWITAYTTAGANFNGTSLSGANIEVHITGVYYA